MNPYRIILADDHILLRRGLKKIIDGSDNMVVTEEAGDGLELLEILKGATPEMVILDISMPKLGGIEATRQIKMSKPGVKVLVLTMHKRKEYMFHVLEARPPLHASARIPICPRTSESFC
ncbi:response regulator transcription factor [Candidatus Poribacteria bacterium]|nr:response regulator transcription factor [Candidatus Poribacteria bacterium]